MSDHPPVPAGWYDDATDPAIKRYWDGVTWTDHTAPADAVPVSKPGGLSRNAKGGLIAAAVVAVLLIGSIAAAGIARNANPTSAGNVDQTTAPSQSATPTPSATPETDASIIQIAQFKSDTTRDLNDFEKDLNDMVTTVNEGGYFRLLSNSVELKFNHEQLKGASAPDSVEPGWTLGLIALNDTINAIDDAIGTNDDTTIRAAIEASRAQVNALRAIVAGA